VLRKTLGVPLFQEQAMRLAVVAAGFTPGEADQLRRAMGAWRRPGLIDQFRRKLIEGMRARGLSQKYAKAVFQQIRGFGDYGFPESHAASFALLAYVSAWLKHYYQAAFTAALLNSQPMGFYAPSQLVRSAREHGVEVRPVDVSHSRWESTLEPREGEGKAEERSTTSEKRKARQASVVHRTVFALRLGFHMLEGMSESHARRIEEARAKRPFSSMDDLTGRTGLKRSVVARLAKAGAFGSLDLDRREALWHALGQDQKELPLFDRLDSETARMRDTRHSETSSMPETHPSEREETVGNAKDGSACPGKIDLPRTSPAEEVLADYRATGLSLAAHPMKFLRSELEKAGVVPAEQLRSLPNGGPVRVAGIVLVRQRPGTAKGITFVTLEDETGVANLIIRPDVWKRWRSAALGATVMLAHGRLQRQGLVIHVLSTRLENLSDRLKDLGSTSRDFC
jgi:error-prone DNA polymerase